MHILKCFKSFEALEDCNLKYIIVSGDFNCSHFIDNILIDAKIRIIIYFLDLLNFK